MRRHCWLGQSGQFFLIQTLAKAGSAGRSNFSPAQLSSIHGFQTAFQQSLLKFVGNDVTLQITKNTLVSQPVNTWKVSIKEIDCRTGANTSFFALFTLALSSGPGARDTRDAWGASSAAGCKRNFKKPNKGSMLLFRWVYFLSKVNVKNRIKIRDSMLTWRKRVTDFRSHAKGHTILCDVYYQPTNDWSDERFSKSKSLVCDEFLFLLPPDWSKNSCNSCFDALGLSIHGRIRTQLLSKRTFVMSNPFI